MTTGPGGSPCTHMSTYASDHRSPVLSKSSTRRYPRAWVGVGVGVGVWLCVEVGVGVGVAFFGLADVVVVVLLERSGSGWT